MERRGFSLKKTLFTSGLCILLFLVACSKEEIETNMSEEVADFTFTTQKNEPISLSDLEGKWWIADFVFTNCTTVCLPMTSNMAALQTKIKEDDLNVHLVSFTVDPDYDTPEVLTKYGESYGADFSSWSFVTGYDFETIKRFSSESFLSPIIEPPPGEDQVQHGTRFFLINPDGDIVKNYEGINADEIDNILDDLKIVVDE